MVVEDSQVAVAVLLVTVTTLQTHLVDKVVVAWLSLNTKRDIIYTITLVILKHGR